MVNLSFGAFLIEQADARDREREITNKKLETFTAHLLQKYKIKELILTDVSRAGTKMLRLSIINIDVKESGTGSKVMEEIVNYADENSYLMVLNPSDDYGSDVKRLEKFYERFGFMVNRGSTKMPGIFEKMFRIPNFGKD